MHSYHYHYQRFWRTWSNGNGNGNALAAIKTLSQASLNLQKAFNAMYQEFYNAVEEIVECDNPIQAMEYDYEVQCHCL